MAITNRDILTFEAIQRHWWLPSHYLHEFTKDEARNAFFHRKRLLQLVEDGYLARPEELNNPMVKNDFLAYTLTKKSLAILETLGKRSVHAAPPGGGYAHAAMTVAITANIELGARAAGIRFITQEEILRQAPETTRKSKHRLSLPARIERDFDGRTKVSEQRVTPDALFGLDYGGGDCRFFAVEADRGKETLEPSKSFKNSSILRKFLSYKNIFETGAYKKQWGIPNLFPLFVTTAEDRVRNMLALADKVYPKGSSNVLFSWLPGFFHFHRSPPLFPDLLTRKWERAGREPFDISKP